ncbi:hypothetical protein Tco_0088412 [Tanacetum coccineum]
MEFEVRDRVMLKVLPWKGVVHFVKRGKLNPRYVRPFKVLAKVGKVAYRMELPQEFSKVHHTFHASNLKKCYTDEALVMPLEGIHIDDKLQFVEEPVEIMERKIKRLKRSRIPLVKVCWNSRRGPEFTWEPLGGNRTNQREASEQAISKHLGLLVLRNSLAQKAVLLHGEYPCSTRGRAAAIVQPWEDFKKLLMEEYCPDDEIQKLETEFWNHKLVGSNIDRSNDQNKNLGRDDRNKRQRFGRNFALTAPEQGMDWLSKLRAKIVCFEKIVQIPLSNRENSKVHGERPERNLKQLKTMKVNEPKLEDILVARDFCGVHLEDLSGLPLSREVEFRKDLIPGAMPVAKSPYRLAHTEMQELSNQLKELQDKGFI